ncbi:uncharacterized protein si:ch211-113e8.11 [Xyrichtys novacula]|uniref:Uncharacterized protein si:ch211-113e8.11 n=1 Tax=Xyrichtys novacula TaxID=13765 RepID=A0AAV1EUP9_XYRNO|nr:uncharacterized protein si:ch211-113e8.11 [Xyrichtys novacula]
MNSLVGYVVSSGSDSDEDTDGGKNNNTVGGETADETSAVKRTRNFLLEPGSTSSESESEPEPEGEDPESSSSSPTPAGTYLAALQPTLSPPCSGSNKLPPPTLNTSSDSSVFANPFKAQADQKLSALQKHVPLTLQAKPSQIGGKRVCVSYRKDGRCRFGIKCKFAHDSDLQTPVTITDCNQPVNEETPASDPVQCNESDSSCSGSQTPQQETKEKESGGQQVKKRKVGLSNTLIPPKRAMKQYAMLRDREQVNMR